MDALIPAPWSPSCLQDDRGTGCWGCLCHRQRFPFQRPLCSALFPRTISSRQDPVHQLPLCPGKNPCSIPSMPGMAPRIMPWSGSQVFIFLL